MSQKWYYAKGDHKYGPFTASQLKELAATGQIHPSDFLRGDGMSKWIKAGLLKGLYHETQSVPPPVPPTASQTKLKHAPNGFPPAPITQTTNESDKPLDFLISMSVQNVSGTKGSSIPRKMTFNILSRATLPLCWLGVILFAIAAIWYAYSWDKARRIKSAIAIGGELWNKGEKDKAVEEYKQVLDSLDAGSVASMLYQRVIDYYVGEKDLVSAKQIINTAKVRGIAVVEFEEPSHDKQLELLTTVSNTGNVADVASSVVTPASNNRPSYSWNDIAVITCDLKHPFAHMDVALSPDSSLMAYSGDDIPVKLYDVASGKEIVTIESETDSDTEEVIFSPDKKLLALNTLKGVRIWNVQEKRIVKNLDSHMIPVNSKVASHAPFSPDGKTVAIYSGGNVVFWDTASWKRLKELPYWHAVFSPDGKTIATYSGGNVVLWDTASWNQLEELPGCKYAIFSQDGTLLAMDGIEKDTVMLWDLKLHKARCTLKREPKIEYYQDRYSLTDDGKYLLRFHNNKFTLWDTLSGETKATLEPGSGDIYAWALSRDGSFLVIGGGRRLSTDAGVVTVCDLNTGQVAYLTGHKERVNSMSLSADGELLATMSSDRTIRLWKRHHDTTGRFAFVAAPQQLYGDAVDSTVKGPSGEKVMVGGDGLNSDWFFHYYLDKDGKQIQHGTSRVPYTGAVTGKGRMESNYDHGTLLSRSIYGSDGTLTTQYQQVKDNTYQRDEYRSISDGSRVHLRSLVTITKTAEGEEYKTIAGREIVSDNKPLPPVAGRELKVTIQTAGHTSDPIAKMFNSSLKSVKCYATSDELISDLLDVDGTPWQGEQRTGWILALLVRLFDRNGNYLTHFTTTEGFTLDWDAYDMHIEGYENAKRLGMTVDGYGNPVRKPTLLKRNANRLTYTVNMRDLRDAAIVEIGFMEPGH